MSHVFHNIPLKEISRNYSNRCLSLRNALVHVCDQTHPLTMSISVKREHTHLPSTWHAHATTQHCVCVLEKVTRRDILQMLHVKEEESSTAIHPSPPSNTPLTRNERAKGVIGGGREGGELKGKRDDWQKKRTNRKGERKSSSTCMWERGNYHRHVYSLLMLFQTMWLPFLYVYHIFSDMYVIFKAPSS